MSSTFPVPPPLAIAVLFGGSAALTWVIIIASVLQLRLVRLPGWRYLQIFLRIPWLRYGRRSRRVLITLLVPLASLLSYLFFTGYAVSVTVSEDELTVNIPPCFLYKTIRREDIVKAFVANCNTLTELKSALRTFGISWPGYHIGWFKLANGADALLAVKGDRVLVLELKEGIHLLLAPPDFEGFLEVFERDVMPIGDSF